MSLTQDDFQPLNNILASRLISDDEFRHISDMIYRLCRINLHDGKKALVQARLNKRLRKLGFETYSDYLRHVEQDASGRELTLLINTLTTNLTYFFREADHFDHLKNDICGKWRKDNVRRVRLWSAGCSSGEEAYTLAMVLREALPGIDRMDALILATDLSTGMVARARDGAYAMERFKDTPAGLRLKYFNRGKNGAAEVYTAKPELAKLIRFRHLNLMEPWPMNGKFDVIMCRNVMIYFDKSTQNELVGRFYEALEPGGVFMVGHSESLTGIKHGFRYVRPTVYRKP